MFEAYRTEIIRAAKAARPHEMCGVIHAGRFVQLENAHPEPERHFAFTDADTLRYMADPLTEAIVHSHPTSHVDGACPSKFDLEQQLATAKPWIIAAFEHNYGSWKYIEWGAHTIDSAILEQPFVYGVHDCWTLVRKWYWQNRQILLPTLATDYGWWDEGGNVYLDNYKAYGFQRLNPEPQSLADLKPGDMFFYPLGAPVYNHAGIYVGNGEIYHHARGRLSTSDVLGPWFRRVNFWMRHESAQ